MLRYTLGSKYRHTSAGLYLEQEDCDVPLNWLLAKYTALLSFHPTKATSSLQTTSIVPLGTFFFSKSDLFLTRTLFNLFCLTVPVPASFMLDSFSSKGKLLKNHIFFRSKYLFYANPFKDLNRFTLHYKIQHYICIIFIIFLNSKSSSAFVGLRLGSETGTGLGSGSG